MQVKTQDKQAQSMLYLQLQVGSFRQEKSKRKNPMEENITTRRQALRCFHLILDAGMRNDGRRRRPHVLITDVEAEVRLHKGLAHDTT
eukprot:2410496-Amphidinium_carterae.2